MGLGLGFELRHDVVELADEHGDLGSRVRVRVEVIEVGSGLGLGLGLGLGPGLRSGGGARVRVRVGVRVGVRSRGWGDLGHEVDEPLGYQDDTEVKPRLRPLHHLVMGFGFGFGFGFGLGLGLGSVVRGKGVSVVLCQGQG